MKCCNTLYRLFIISLLLIYLSCENPVPEYYSDPAFISALSIIDVDGNNYKMIEQYGNQNQHFFL